MPSSAGVEVSTSQRPATTAVPARTIFDFAAPASVNGWYNQDDPVMGGRSRSAATWRDGVLVFAGDLSLENNGGFASVLSPRDEPIGPRLAGASALVLHATGDGRTYVVQLRRADEPGAYIQRLPTEAGVERSYELPLSGFEPVDFMLRPRPDAVALDPAALGQLAVYVTDKQEGPFGLAVRRIDAVP
ncbi:MAG: CIA30 family protein [Acidimicrobiales bacterium]